MRVLSVQHYPTFGGPYNELLLLDDALRARGVDTVVVMTDEPGTALSRIESLPSVQTMPLSRIRMSLDPRLHIRSASHFASDVSRLRAAIRREKVDLVKVHGPHNPHGAVAARLENVPVIWVISSTRVPRAFRRLGMALVRQYAAAVLVTGRSLLDAYPGGSALKERSFAYYPPVDTSVFMPLPASERAAVRNELGVSADAQLIGTVANINPQKGIAEFVRVAARVHQHMPQTHFVVVGAVAQSQLAYYDRVRDEASNLGLRADRISWLGERSDVARLVGAFDIKVISSVPLSEGTPTTAGEAMACEVPVVSTNVGAVAEVVEHGKTGYIIDDHKATSIAGAIIELLANDKKRLAMGKAGRQRIMDHFTLEQCADVHRAAYDFALSGSRYQP